jgi:hypothetical protein
VISLSAIRVPRPDPEHRLRRRLGLAVLGGLALLAAALAAGVALYLQVAH